MSHDLIVSAPVPFAQMADHPTSNHVQFNIEQTFEQITARFDQHNVEIVTPEHIGSLLAPIVLAREFANHLAHEPADFDLVRRLDQQMDMIANDGEIEQAQRKLAQAFQKLNT